MTILFRSGSRLEAFSDGVFAIAITLLILEIHVPSAQEAGTPSLLWHALLERWPSYFAFLLSFWTILTSWIGHHVLFQEVKAVSRTLVWVNGAFLLFVTVLPFTTALVAGHLTHPSGRVAALVYAAFNTIAFLLYLLLARFSHTEHPREDDTLRFVSANALWGIGLCLLATALAYFSPLWSLLLVGLTWLSWTLPPWVTWRHRS